MRDLQADFLGIYGIDLRRDAIDGPTFFALAHRAAAYQGVMQGRVEAEREETAPAQEPARQAAPQVSGGGTAELSLTAFRVQFPGLVSMATSGK